MQLRIGKSVHKAAILIMVSTSLLLAGNAFAGEKGSSGEMYEMYNLFGGPAYTGAQALPLLAALVEAGGGPDHFSLLTALTHTLGDKTVKAEVSKLTKQYGRKRVTEWGNGFKFAVDRTLVIMGHQNIELPASAQPSGTQLAKELIAAGTAPDGVFWTGRLFDHILSHDIHNQIMIDTDKKYAHDYDRNYHEISNQAFYDFAQTLGIKDVKLAPLH